MKDLRLNECRSYWSEADGGKQNRVHEASSGRGPRSSLQMQERCKKDDGKSKKGKHTKILASPRQRSSDTPEAFSVNLMNSKPHEFTAYIRLNL
jgi:hypothetical protein